MGRVSELFLIIFVIMNIMSAETKIILSIILCILILGIYRFTDRYIESEGKRAGLDDKEISRWKFKAVLFGCLPGLLLFRRSILNKK